MNKFWQWMEEEKNYGYTGIYGNVFLFCEEYDDENDVPIEPTKQMLIGYMIEYLHGIGVIHKTPFNMTTEGLYCYLEDLIDEIEELK
jgi:hypothetical protein